MADYPIWALLCFGVMVMSGAGSILREGLDVYLDIYQPTTKTKESKKSRFWTSMRIAFIISAVLVWYAEHQNVISLKNQLDSKRMQIYLDILEERERLVDLFNRKYSIDENYILICVLDKKEKNPANMQLATHLTSEREKCMDEIDVEKAKYIKSEEEAKIVFNDPEINRLKRSAFPHPNLGLTYPQEQDLKDLASIQAWVQSTNLKNWQMIDASVGGFMDLLLDLMKKQLISDKRSKASN